MEKYRYMLKTFGSNICSDVDLVPTWSFSTSASTAPRNLPGFGSSSEVPGIGSSRETRLRGDRWMDKARSHAA